MLSGSHLVIIGMAAMALAFAVCRLVEAIKRQKRRTNKLPESPTADP